MGCVERALDVLGIGARDLAERLARDRRDVLEVLAARRRDPLAADVVSVAFLEVDREAEASGFEHVHADLH
jgi:hypothetical protein